jgi:hypothetical protein
MKKFKNWLENHGFFDEDHQFFKGFEITKTSNSLILIYFFKKRNCQFSGFGIFKESKPMVL